jgi:hypothetical protein
MLEWSFTPQQLSVRDDEVLRLLGLTLQPACYKPLVRATRRGRVCRIALVTRMEAAWYGCLANI